MKKKNNMSKARLIEELRKPASRPAMSPPYEYYGVSNVTVVGISLKLDIIAEALARLLEQEDEQRPKETRHMLSCAVGQWIVMRKNIPKPKCTCDVGDEQESEPPLTTGVIRIHNKCGTVVTPPDDPEEPMWFCRKCRRNIHTALTTQLPPNNPEGYFPKGNNR